MHTSPVGLSFRLPLLFVSLIFSREVKGEREGKQRKGVGSARRIGEGGRLEGREGRNEGRREGGGILMVADYAADFTRLGFSVPFSASTLCARQAKKPLYSAAKDGGLRLRGGLGNDSRKSARASVERSLKWDFHFHLKSGIPTLLKSRLS